MAPAKALSDKRKEHVRMVGGSGGSVWLEYKPFGGEW